MDVSNNSPPNPINRRQLTILLLAISLIPPIFVVAMVMTHKPPPEPMLKAIVIQDVTVHSSRKTPDNPRILPCIIVENPTTEPWRNVSVYLNKEFLFHQPGSVESGQRFTVPLEFFVTKGGNVAFQPGSESVRQVTIFAQIPSGARAVSENYFDSHGKVTDRQGLLVPKLQPGNALP